MNPIAEINARADVRKRMALIPTIPQKTSPRSKQHETKPECVAYETAQKLQKGQEIALRGERVNMLA